MRESFIEFTCLNRRQAIRDLLGQMSPIKTLTFYGIPIIQLN
jgi:hypothetical protein